MMTFILAGLGDLNVRKGSRVLSTLDLVTASRISSMTPGMVKMILAWPRSVDTGGSFLIIGPASMMRLWTGLGVVAAISGGIMKG